MDFKLVFVCLSGSCFVHRSNYVLCFFRSGDRRNIEYTPQLGIDNKQEEDGKRGREDVKADPEASREGGAKAATHVVRAARKFLFLLRLKATAELTSANSLEQQLAGNFHRVEAEAQRIQKRNLNL